MGKSKDDVTNDKPIIVISDFLSTFLQFMREAKSDYAYYNDLVKKCQDQTQDILHTLELQNLNAVQMMKLTKELISIRRERRTYKNFVEVYEPIINFMDNNSTGKCIKDLERLLGQVRKVEKYHSDRQYRLKTKNHIIIDGGEIVDD